MKLIFDKTESEGQRNFKDFSLFRFHGFVNQKTLFKRDKFTKF